MGKSPARQNSQTSQASQASTASFDINIHAPTPPLQPIDQTPNDENVSSPADSLKEARRELNQEVDVSAARHTPPEAAISDLASTPTPLEAINEKI